MWFPDRRNSSEKRLKSFAAQIDALLGVAIVGSYMSDEYCITGQTKLGHITQASVEFPNSNPCMFTVVFTGPACDETVAHCWCF